MPVATQIVEEMVEKLDFLQSGLIGNKQNSSEQVISQTVTLLHEVDTTGEDKFRASMKQLGNKVAARQAQLLSLLESLQESASGQEQVHMIFTEMLKRQNRGA